MSDERLGPGRAEVARQWLLLARMAVQAWPLGALISLLQTPLVSVAPTLAAITVGRVIDATLRGHQEAALLWVGALVALLLIVDVLYPLGDYASDKVDSLVQNEANRRLMLATASAPGLEHLEDPEYADRMQALAGSPAGFNLLLNNARTLVGSVLSLTIAASVLFSISWVLVVAPALILLAEAVQVSLVGRQWRSLDAAARSDREASMWAGFAVSPATAKEVRLLNLSEHFQERFGFHRSRAVAARGRAKLMEATVAAIRGVASGATLGGGIAILLYLASTGRATAGQVATGMGMLQTLLAGAGGVSFTAVNLTSFGNLVRRFTWLVDYRSNVALSPDPAPIPSTLATGLIFENVSFAYRRTDRVVLSSINLVLRPGQTVALVGANGSGKSTLLKLLCRFYDPTGGRITLDGVDLRAVDLGLWRASVSAAFQDYVNYQFRLVESIGLGDLAKIDNPEVVQSAVAAGGAGPLIAGLADGFDTQLGKEFPGGVDLSQGQWRSVALSRAMMRQPMLLILDEPTASLDAAAEKAVFDRFMAAAAESRRRGAITVIVSHRFTTVTRADVIVVMDSGSVIESGSHAELLAAGGLYSELFHLQAAGYA